MARHSSGKTSFRLAGWVWTALISLLVIVVLFIGWQKIAQNNRAEINAPACAEGEYTMRAWVAPERAAAAQEIADKYNSSSRVVRDKCTRINFSTVSDQEVKDKLNHHAHNAAWLPADPSSATEAARKSGLNVSAGDTAEIGGGRLLVFDTGKHVDEQASRTAQDFEKFASENGAGKVTAGNDPAAASGSLNTTDAPPVAAKPEGGSPDATGRPGEGGQPTPAPPRDVVFVLDTSGSMTLIEGSAPRLDNVRGPLARAMRQIGARGGAVGLWNYSSPISKSANFPYRNNVDITNRDNGAISAAILGRLGAQGATHTYESITAAYASAVAAASTPQAQAPARVILITDGPNDGGSLSLGAAQQQILKLHETSPVRLDVIAIGPNVERPAMESIAGAASGKVHYAPNSLTFEGVLQKALQ